MPCKQYGAILAWQMLIKSEMTLQDFICLVEDKKTRTSPGFSDIHGCVTPFS